MRVGERFYESFELRTDAARTPDEASFAADLQCAQEPSELGKTAGDEAVRAAQELVASAIATAQVAAPAADFRDRGSAIATAQVAAPAADLRDVRKPAPTPLELAVMALLDEPAASAPEAPIPPVGDDPADSERDPGEPTAEPSAEPCLTMPAAVEPARPPAHPAPGKPGTVIAVREPAPLPEHPNPSHVHLVLEDGAERVVVTVAVRGNEVNVGVRASDDQLAAALARNAATLDHAMRARGLDLASFSAERDSAHDDHERQPPDPHERDPHAERFSLEEIA
jgi:hypothetical protein